MDATTGALTINKVPTNGVWYNIVEILCVSRVIIAHQNTITGVSGNLIGNKYFSAQLVLLPKINSFLIDSRNQIAFSYDLNKVFDLLSIHFIYSLSKVFV